MINMGFWELGLIGLVLLFLIGPKRLPGVVRRLGYWMGKAKKMKQSLKNESERLMGDDDDEDKPSRKK